MSNIYFGDLYVNNDYNRLDSVQQALVALFVLFKAHSTHKSMVVLVLFQS